MDIVILTQAEAQSRDHVGGGGRLLVAGQCHRAPHWSPLLLLRYLQHFILGHQQPHILGSEVSPGYNKMSLLSWPI